MAFNYTSANTGLFCRAGKFLKYIISHLTDATTTLPAEASAIIALYENAGATTNGLYVAQVGDLPAAYDGFKQLIVSIRQSLASYVDRALLDNDTTISQLPGPPSADVNSVNLALHQQMLNDAATINASSVTLGSVTANSTNNGNGVVLVTKVLDGYNPPLLGSAANIRYNALSSQLTVTSETMTWICNADSMRDGTSEGAEQFSWTGGIEYQPLDYRAQGSGPGPGLQVADQSQSLITDGDFENWSSNSPTNWTLITNTVAGTQIFQEATNIYRQSSSMKLINSGAVATIGVTQAVSPSTLRSRRRHLVAFRVKAASVPAAGTILINFTGTGYSKTAPTDAAQTLAISGTPTGGTYTITYTGPYGGAQTTSALAYNASAATVQTALRLLSGLECVTVTAAGSTPNFTHTITFYGQPGAQTLITADITGMTGGSPAKVIASTVTGVEGDCVVIPAGAFPTAWHLMFFWINTPAVIPSDWTLSVSCGSTLTNAVAVYFDSGVFAPAVYHGGIAAVFVAGSTRFTIGDTFTVTVANNGAGLFQEFWRIWYRFQLPSSGSPTISDSLAG